MVPTTLLKVLKENTFLEDVATFYKNAGFQLYLVGGAVRDGILDIPTTDFDFTTDATVDESLKLFKNNRFQTTEIGKAFGTIEAIYENFSLHITTFREDSYKDTSRKPEIISSNNLENDLKRRDFTINAIAYDLLENKLIDPYSGLKDLSQGIITTPISADISFSDDPLRMLRACRFISSHGFSPDTETFEAIKKNINRIEIVSSERIRDELNKLLIGDNPSLGIRAFVESGLSLKIMPELDKLKIEVDPKHHHKDVYEHTLIVVDRVLPNIVSRLAALLHDIGKPNTKGIDNGKVHFRHHEVVGARISEQILKRLKYSKKEIQDICLLVENHLRPHTFKMGWTDSAVRRYIVDSGEMIDKLNNLVRADITTKNKNKYDEITTYLDEMEDRIAEVKEKEELSNLRPPITGDEVMEIFDLQPGPTVGKIMKALYEQRLNEGEVSKEEAIKLAKAIYKKL
ncbi:MAG: CCA tRNA nucleotidyltransferase [Candidatus Actinomarina sp.]|nr:CCA tRNA nucleotidyltransferase [Candidatus Actinomarina sp.]